jgi:hypothetical protein
MVNTVPKQEAKIAALSLRLSAPFFLLPVRFAVLNSIFIVPGRHSTSSVMIAMAADCAGGKLLKLCVSLCFSGHDAVDGRSAVPASGANVDVSGAAILSAHPSFEDARELWRQQE